MKNKKFDIIDAILESFDYAPMSKERAVAYEEDGKYFNALRESLNPKQKKLLNDYENKKNQYLIMHEKDVANYVLQCLRSILK